MTVRSKIDELQVATLAAATGGGTSRLFAAQAELIDMFGCDSVGLVLTLASSTLELHQATKQSEETRTALYIATLDLISLDPVSRTRITHQISRIVGAAIVAEQTPTTENRWELVSRGDNLASILGVVTETPSAASDMLTRLMDAARASAATEAAENTLRAHVLTLRTRIEGFGA
jgi:hypothetical protein